MSEGELESLEPRGIDINKEEDSRYPDLLFDEKRERVLDTVQAATLTRHYQGVIDNKSINNYSDFKNSIPITTSSDFYPPEDFAVGNPDDMYTTHSGGSTGRRIKTIYYPKEAMVAKITDPILDILKAAQNPTLLHKDVHALSYHVTEASIINQAPNVKVTTYLPETEVVEKIRPYDVIYATDQVSKFRELMHEFEKKASENPQQLAEDLKGKRFLLELESEPIEIDEVKKWYDFLEKYTGEAPEVWGLYGCSETLLIGMWIYKPGDEKVKYKVTDQRFVEVLREDGNNLPSGERGRVIVTPLRPKDYQGTVLLRYDTGDFATVEVDDNNEMYLSDVARKPEDGMISIWGHKIYVPQVQSVLQQDLGFPISMRVGYKTVELESGKEQIKLKIDMYSPDFSDANKADDAKKKIFDALTVAIPTIQEFLDWDKLGVEINLGPEAPKDLIKAWQIRKDDKATQ